MPIDDLDRAILDFANLQFRHVSVERAEIRRRFGWTRAHYYDRLNVLIDLRDAQRYAHLTCDRYRSLRDSAREQNADEGVGDD